MKAKTYRFRPLILSFAAIGAAQAASSEPNNVPFQGVYGRAANSVSAFASARRAAASAQRRPDGQRRHRQRAVHRASRQRREPMRKSRWAPDFGDTEQPAVPRC